MGDVNVSIAICTRNRAQPLRETLQSFAAVRVPRDWNVELLVVDNGSNDDTAEVAKNCRLQNFNVRYLHEPRAGQCNARNTALEQARGGIILFTDDDVRFPANWIHMMCLPILEKKADAVCAGLTLAPHLKRSWVTTTFCSHWLTVRDNPGDRQNHLLTGANMGFSKEVLNRVPAFDSELDPGALGFGGDTLFSLQLMEAGFRIRFVSGASVEHHFSEDRLLRRNLLDLARKRGRTKAYIRHHWEHRVASRTQRKLFRTLMTLAWQRCRRMRECLQTEGAPDWEMVLVRSVYFYRQLLIEKNRTRNYAKRGLVKLDRLPANHVLEDAALAGETIG